jgi:alkylation response protein AidB-like acyl-CoA dehydrogenase
MAVRLTSVDDEDFRKELRTWLADNDPLRDPGFGELDALRVQTHRDWQARLAEAGWAGVSWPVEYGGRGATATQQLIFHQECAAQGVYPSPLFFVSLSHAAPTVIAHGTDAQRAAWLPPILSGAHIYAQCFSEPGAGSDLAAISTRGVVEGAHLVVSGEKRWSTNAHLADRCELLVRTDRDNRHGGLTFVMADLDAPGVTTRSTPAITGMPEFSEVFFDDVRIPLDRVLGKVGDGWKVATTTLSHERTTGFASTIVGLRAVVSDIGSRLGDDPARRAELASLATEVLATEALLAKSASEQQAGAPGPGSAALKLIGSELNHRLLAWAVEEGYPHLERYLLSFGLKIGGGTSEIQRNILAERTLNLPRA